MPTAPLRYTASQTCSAFFSGSGHVRRERSRKRSNSARSLCSSTSWRQLLTGQRCLSQTTNYFKNSCRLQRGCKTDLIADQMARAAIRAMVERRMIRAIVGMDGSMIIARRSVRRRTFRPRVPREHRGLRLCKRPTSTAIPANIRTFGLADLRAGAISTTAAPRVKATTQHRSASSGMMAKLLHGCKRKAIRLIDGRRRLPRPVLWTGKETRIFYLFCFSITLLDSSSNEKIRNRIWFV